MNALLVLHVVICSVNHIASYQYPGNFLPLFLQEAEEPPFLYDPPQQSPIDILTMQSVRSRLPALRLRSSLSKSGDVTVTNNGKTGNFLPLFLRGAEEPPFLHDPPQQSPIDILTMHSVRRRLPALQIRGSLSKSGAVTVTNNGKTVNLVLDEDSVKPLLFGGPLESLGEFVFSSLHFHWGLEDDLGSEHEIDSDRLTMEAHCVHFNYKYGTLEEALNHPDGLAVVAFLFEVGDKDNPELERLVRLLSRVPFPLQSVTVSARDALGWLSPARWKSRGYFTYPGSLTTPPYAENVVWIVYPEPIHLSSRQVQHFRKLRSTNGRFITHNSRSVQHLNGRTVIYAE